MTSRERIEAALNHVEPDRTPYFEYVLLPPVAAQLLGRRFVEYGDDWPDYVREKGWENAVREYAVNRLELAARLGHDMMCVVPNPLPPENSEPPTQVCAPPVDDPVERISRRIEVSSQQMACMPEDSCLVYHVLKEEMCRRGIDLPLLAPAYAHGVWTDVDLMQTMVLASEVAEKYFEQQTRHSLAVTDIYIDIGIDLIGIGGDFAGNQPLISPESYRRFIVPEVRKVSRRIHSAHRWAVNASDGNLWPVIDDFLTGCEVDAYLEIDLHAGMEMRQLKERYGDKITLIGNMDCGITMSFGTPAEIRGRTIKCLEDGMGNGGHIFCCSNAITSSVPLENYIALVNAYREVFGLTGLLL